MPRNGDDLWDAIKRELGAVLAPAVFQARVATTIQLAREGETLVVRCPDLASCQWLDRQLGRMIREISISLTTDPPTIRFVPPDDHR